jgi:predicted AAA+ superfamily ATPase
MQDDLDERQKEEWLKELIDREARRINMKQIMEEQMDKYYHNKKTS